MENRMPYEVVEKVKNNSEIVLISETDFKGYLKGYRTTEEQAERLKAAGLQVGLSEEVCNDMKVSITEIYNNPDLSSLTDFDIEQQTAIRTTIYPSEEFYNNVISIRNFLDKGTTIWTLISKQTV